MPLGHPAAQHTHLTAGSAEQAQQYAEEAARLGSFARLLDLHWDAAAQQFRDWGNHTQDVALQWQVNRLPNGRIVSRELVRVVQGEPPEPQFVPHFGCAPLQPVVCWCCLGMPALQ